METAPSRARATRQPSVGGLGILRRLVGSGDRIALVTLSIAVVGLIANLANQTLFGVGGPPSWLFVLSFAILAVGLVGWLWSVVLILTKVPKGKLITSGPYRLVRHPLYTAVALLVLPWLGFLLNTWLGAAVGIVLYLASRRFAPAEEVGLAKTFGSTWDAYLASVKLPWL